MPRLGYERYVLATGGLGWLTQVSVTSGYLDGILGPMLLFGLGLGMGLLFVPLTIVAVSGVAPQEAGAAFSLLNVTQQAAAFAVLALVVALAVIQATPAAVEAGPDNDS